MELIHINYLISEWSITYLYIIHLIDQKEYPIKKYWVRSKPKEQDEIKSLLFTIKLQHDTGSYEDMPGLIVKLAKLKQDDFSFEIKEFIKQILHKYVELDENSRQLIGFNIIKTNVVEYKRELELYK